MRKLLWLLLLLELRAPAAHAQNGAELVIAQGGQTTAAIVVDPAAAADKTRRWEQQAALDLQTYIEKMSGAKPAIALTPEAGAAALQGTAPVFVVGEAALRHEPVLGGALQKAAKPNPVFRATAIVLRRVGNRVYLAGNHDEAHYFAVAQLLQRWGCRWYAPGETGEVVPSKPTLTLGALDVAYGPPFEIRAALNRGSDAAWRLRNFLGSMNAAPLMGSLHTYTGDIVPEGKTVYNVPFAERATAQHVADKIAAQYEKGVGAIPLAAFIGEYASDSARDNELRAGIVSKYSRTPSSTDAMLELYNNIARILRERYPQSRTKLIGIAYASVFLPPQRAFMPEPSLVMWLVPVDIDPNHAIDDPRAPQRQEWGAMLRRWSEVMQGRVAVYDYEQAMLVWRDLPSPNIHVTRRDYKLYRDLGILGINPEPRGGVSQTFLNSYFRAQLMWNPDADVDAMLEEFYAGFYGPAAGPMRAYWQTLFRAWESTLVTEHEYFVIPAIYPAPVVEELRRHLAEAEKSVAPLAAKTTRARGEEILLDRLKMMRLGFEVLDAYTAMQRAGAAEADYAAASVQGRRGLAATLALAQWKPEWSPHISPKLKTLEPGGDPSTWAGEVAQYEEARALTDGSKGTLIAKLPLEWAFRRDPHDTGLARGWAYAPVDLTFWNANAARFAGEARKDYPDAWETLRTDLYLQAQGVRHPDGQSFTGHGWYRTETELTAAQLTGAHLRFPGLFNECWLYVNGNLVAHRAQNPIWAQNSYKFEWDVNIAGALRPGKNTIGLRIYNPAYLGGIFRRPFLYRPGG